VVGGRGDDHGQLPRRGGLTITPRTAVVIPTRDRPASLRRCLEALAAARERTPFEAFVCDSSDHSRRAEIAEICAPYPWAQLRFHEGRTIARARNFCVEVAEAELLVSVDDDVQVAPEAIEALLAAYDRRTGPTVVAGAVVWGREAIPPMVLRPIGYGRAARDGERPDFINSSLFLYPRAYGRQWPWNERMRRGSDVLMGAIWRRAGVAMVWAPDARAEHEEDRDVLTAERHGDYVYALLAHALIAARRPARLLLIETVTLAAGVKGYVRSLAGLREYLGAWGRGHVAFVRDYRALRALAARPVPEP
jgi:glycosyltransferase involved in cell wall biosynthesis